MDMKNLVRQACSLAVVGAFMAAASPAWTGPLDGQKVRIATWGGPWLEYHQQAIQPKLEALGATVEYVNASPQDNLAKLIAAWGRGEAPFDTMEVLDAQWHLMRQGDFIQKLDLDIIENKKFLAREDWNEWRTGSWLTQEGICYIKDYFEKEGIPIPDTYNDLRHPKLANRIIIPDISSGAGLAAFGGMSFAAGGDAKNIQPGLDLVKSIDVLKFWKRGAEVGVLFNTGDAQVGLVSAGWCSIFKKGGSNTAFVHPKINADQRGVSKKGWLVVIKGTKVPEAANHYINAYLGHDFQNLYAHESGLTPVNVPVLEKLGSDDPVVASMKLLKAEDVAKMLVIDYSEADISDWSERWTRSVQR